MVLSGVSLDLLGLPPFLLSLNVLENHKKVLLGMSVPCLHLVLVLRLRPLYPWRSIFSAMKAMSPG